MRKMIPLIIAAIFVVNVILIVRLAGPHMPNSGRPFTGGSPAAYIIESVAALPSAQHADTTTAGSISQDDEPSMPTSAFAVHLEWRLVDTNQDGTDLVETYREFEIYKDHRNRVVKEVPTEYYRYLRYFTAEED